jgi:hypothetical protein
MTKSICLCSAYQPCPSVACQATSNRANLVLTCAESVGHLYVVICIPLIQREDGEDCR